MNGIQSKNKLSVHQHGPASTTLHDGVKLRWRLEGSEGGPALVLLNSIGTDMSLWSMACHELQNFRLLRIDTRGHGGSEAPAGDYTLAMLAADVIAIMDAAGMCSAALAGVSLGGMIAMEIAATYPQRVTGLILICTSAAMDRSAWAARVTMVREQGMAAIAALSAGRFFSPGFVLKNPDIVEAVTASVQRMAPQGYAGCAAAIRDMALMERLPHIVAPVLVVAGEGDVSTPYDGHASLITQTVEGADVVHLPCGHLAPLEVPGELAANMKAFLKEITRALPTRTAGTVQARNT